MVRFQLAIQGGGARLVDLLIALSVVDKMEADGRFEITRLAGTSAGALAAAIYACGHGAVDRTLQLLFSDGPRLVDAIGGNSSVSGWLAMFHAWRGRPLLKEGAFREALHTVLVNAAPNLKAPYFFGNLAKPELFVLASHLTNRTAHCYKGADCELVGALMDSCALPFAFRSYKGLTQNPVVDGGLCDNLPSDQLRSEIDRYGQVLAISFPAKITGATPQNAIAFLGDLFSTAISNGVYRSVKSLPEHAVLNIDTEIDTFDFSKALKQDRRAAHEVIRFRTEDWLIRNLRSDTALTVVQGGNADEIMRDLERWYQKIHNPIPRRSVSNSLIVHANSLLPPDNSGSQRDRIEKRYHFAPKDQSIAAMSISINTGSTSKHHDAVVKVTDPFGRNVDIRVLPTLSDTTGRGLLILFEPPLPPMSEEEYNRIGCYKLRYQAKVTGGLSPLLKERQDHVLHRNKRAENYERVNLVISYPKGVPIHAYPRLVPDLGMPAPQSMADEALSDYTSGVPDDFVTKGWFTTNLPQDAILRVDLHLSNAKNLS